MGKYLNEKKLQKELFKRTEGYAANVKRIYDKALGQIIDLVKGTELEDNLPFSFKEYGYSEEVTPILRKMYSQVYQEIRGGVEKEWILANDNNDELVKSVFGERSIEDKQFARYFMRNKEAMDAFFARKTNGLDLSQKVWKYTGMYKTELEATLDLALGEGTPAYSLAAKIKKYLQDPDRYYRRFRVKVGENEDGTPKYGSIWKRRIYDKESDSYRWINDSPRKYHPGQGVYRSSARNAQRLARTETNIAYRTADYERWQQLDFVIGIEIKLSNNHTCKGVKGVFSDICDDLAGKYPKDFKWSGWHPCCRCYSVPILASHQTMDEMVDKILDGESPASVPTPGKQKELPGQFTSWLEKNEERIQKARNGEGSLPYFIKDNTSLIFNPKAPAVPTTPTAKEIARKRHENRTEEEIKAIKARWHERQATYKAGKELADEMVQISDVNILHLHKALKTGNQALIKAETAKLQAIKDEILSYNLLDDPMAVAKEFSMADAKAVQNAVKSKLETYSYQSLEQQLIDVRSEANWVANHKKYATSDVALAAYKKEAKRLAGEIKKQEVLGKMVSVEEFLGKYPHQKKVKDLYKQIQEALQNGSYDDANGLISDANKLMAKKEMEAVKAAAKKSAKSVGDVEKYCDEHRTFDSMVNKKTFEAFQERRIVESGEPWLKASQDSRRSLSGYTDGTFDTINASYWKDHTGCSDGTLIDKILDNCFMTEDVVLRRGCDRSELKSIFGNVFGDAVFAEDYDLLNSLKGAKGVNEGFISTSFDMTGGFHKKVDLRIFAPKGTQAFYAKPVSGFGDGRRANWDGKNAIKEFLDGCENEIIVHRGYEYRFLKAEPGDGSEIRIFIELLTRNKRTVK